MPSGARHSRRSIPDVATAPSLSLRACSIIVRVRGWRTSIANVAARRAGRRRSRRPSGPVEPGASRSAARPLPVPPVSRRRPGGRWTEVAVTLTVRQAALRSAVAGRRCGACSSAAREREFGRRGACGRSPLPPAGDERRIDEPVRQPGGQQARGDRYAQQRRTRDLGRGSALSRDSSLSGRNRLSSRSKSSRNSRHASAVASSATRSRTVVPMQSKLRSVMTTAWSAGRGAAPGRRGGGRGGGRGGPPERARSRRRRAGRGARGPAPRRGRCSTIRVTITRRDHPGGAPAQPPRAPAARPSRSRGPRRPASGTRARRDREEQPERPGDHRETARAS